MGATVTDTKPALTTSSDSELDHALALLYAQHRDEPENRAEIHDAIATVLLEQGRRRDAWLAAKATA
jgi:hypothetical protein